jgi:hypothetical protein
MRNVTQIEIKNKQIYENLWFIRRFELCGHFVMHEYLKFALQFFFSVSLPRMPGTVKIVLLFRIRVKMCVLARILLRWVTMRQPLLPFPENLNS